VDELATRQGRTLTRLSGDDPDPRIRERWLRAAYSDTALITWQQGGKPVSSSSQPSLMALMLEALRVEPGMRVLEVGTGTGYNAALLAERLGDGAVTTVDLQEEITRPARERLARAGYRPSVVTGDGAEGYPGGAAGAVGAVGAPYDRVLATCAMPFIPSGWLRQCRPGALILAPMLSGLVLLTVRDGHAAEGRFLNSAAFFVGLRGSSVGQVGKPAGPDEVRGRVERSLGQGKGAGRERYGLSVRGGRQWVWLDAPDGPVQLDLPT
jgi:protein-L-isoaspartate O-methyltransferase